MINIFYLYGVVEVLNVIYYLRDYLRKYKKNPNKEYEIIDVMNPIDTLSNIDKFGFVMSILSFIWTVMGLFTNHKIYFISLLCITYTFPFIKEKVSAKKARNIFVLNSILRIFILLFIVYKHINFM